VASGDSLVFVLDYSGHDRLNAGIQTRPEKSSSKVCGVRPSETAAIHLGGHYPSGMARTSSMVGPRRALDKIAFPHRTSWEGMRLPASPGGLRLAGIPRPQTAA
jgi:hypothetical protein